MRDESIIRIGVVAFNPPASFRDVLSILRRHVDEIVVIWGRFKDFNMPYRNPPEYIEEYAKLIVSDHERTQHEQRDLYLEGLRTGDYLFFVDTDLIPSNPDGFRKVKDIDADSFSISYLEDKMKRCVLAFRFREGWTHSRGQLLQDEEGKLICNPHYDVHVLDPDILYYFHPQTKNSDSEYKAEYLKYWDAVAE